MNKRVQAFRQSKPFGVVDLIITVALILICTLPLIFTVLSRQEGEIVRIAYGEDVVEYSLSENRTLTFKDGRVVVEIKDGGVRVVKSDCPDSVCVYSRTITAVGESIVCLPNRLVIKIIGDGFDAATGGGA